MMENHRKSKSRKFKSEIISNLNEFQNKADSIVTALTKEYMKDGYKLQDYINDNKNGVIQSQVSNGKNHIRVTTYILSHTINVYKNGKFNNKITF